MASRCTRCFKILRFCSLSKDGSRAKRIPSLVPSSHLVSLVNCRSCSVPPLQLHGGSFLPVRYLSQASPKMENTIKENTDQEESVVKHEFQAETRMLLDIVAKSLYSDKEVFVRELISNASDALEKLRYRNLALSDSGGSAAGSTLEIGITCDQLAKTFTIQDSGLGMNKSEMIQNLGTIARSGSKAFLEELKASGQTPSDAIVGQFGVGFYSAFMVADKVEVFSKSHVIGAKGYRWFSDGSGTYEITECSDAAPGTKIVVHLKQDCSNFADDKIVEGIVKKYSDFVSFPIYLNSKRLNSVQALWTLDSKDISKEMHLEFYRYISKRPDDPMFVLHYKADAPINVRALLYFPTHKPGMMDAAQSADTGVALYSRRVLIQNHTNDIVPRWMRFVKGVVDSEDIPLNLSREMLQQTAVIKKLTNTLTARVLKFLRDKQSRSPTEYADFYAKYGFFLKEGIITSPDQSEKEDLAKLLMFESSSQRPGTQVTLLDYCGRMQAGQREIFYLCAPSRELAESSPYYEAMREKSVEVLFCYEPYDELVLLQLIQFDRKNLMSVEKQVHQDKGGDVAASSGADSVSMTKEQTDKLFEWVKQSLGRKVWEIKSTTKLSTYPCLITVEEMGAARHFAKTQFAGISEDQRFLLLHPTVEINLGHPIISKINQLMDSEPETAKMLMEQVYDNALIAAGLMEDPRSMVGRLNQLLTKMAETR